MRQKFLHTKKTRSKKGADSQGRNRQDQEYARKTGQWKNDNNPATDEGKSGTIYREETGVRHETLTRREWLRAGAGNETIKETGEAEGR